VSKAPVLPASETRSSERTSDNLPGAKIEAPADVPLTPPTPSAVKTPKPEVTATIDDVGESKVLESQIPSSTPPPPPPPPPPAPKKGFFRRLRNFVFTLMVLGAVGFSGGVWYSRINDSFHDFFTEYIPFGEQAVLYLEEREFKQRFPQAAGTRASRPRDANEQVRIPAQSGASWRVADTTEPTARQSSASPTPNKKAAAPKPAEPEKVESRKTSAPDSKAVEKVIDKAEVKPKAEKTGKPKGETAATFQAPEVNEPSKFPPLAPIDLLKLADAREPVVQDMVHMLNDLILVINADGAHGKYGTTINKAKGEINKVGSKLKDLKAKVEKEAAKEVRSKLEEFDKASTELVNRVEQAMISQELQWRQDFEEEMKLVRDSYDDRVKLLLEREHKLNEEKLQNKLLEQAIALKKEFTQEVQSQVEKERDSRLGKLEELASAVADLEKLAVGWNSVVDANLKTQQLHVAVEAVRANLESATQPQPFIKELVALKEIAADDPVVNAAIASVNPASYQRGIFSSSQLIDRFRRVASEVRKASLLPDEAGVASHASSWVLSHVMFQKKGLAEGNDVESILTRTQTFLEEGDLDAAAREMNELEGWAKTLSKDWLGEVRKVLEVQQALDVSFYSNSVSLREQQYANVLSRLLLPKRGCRV
jgi:mitofilin